MENLTLSVSDGRAVVLTRGRGSTSLLPQRRSTSAGLLSRIIPGYIKLYLFFAARIAASVPVGSTGCASSDLQAWLRRWRVALFLGQSEIRNNSG